MKVYKATVSMVRHDVEGEPVEVLIKYFAHREKAVEWANAQGKGVPTRTDISINDVDVVD